MIDKEGTLRHLLEANILVRTRISDAAPAVTDFNIEEGPIVNDSLNGALCIMTSGARIREAHVISDYTAGTKNCAFAVGDQWAVSPLQWDTLIIIPSGLASLMVGAAGKPNVQDVVIYPVAEDALLTELADDGSAPAYYPAAAHSTNVVGEGAAVAAWTEDINFELEGTITIISIYAEFEWQTRFLLGAGNGVNSVSKIQISRDGGANWVDLTDNFINPNAAMTTRSREGVGLWIPTIVAGANQLVIRLVHFVDVGNGISTSECQIRSNSFVRISYRKS